MFMKKTEFTIVVEKDVDGGYVGSVVELPGCYSQGETEKELLENIKEAIELHLSVLHEQHEQKKTITRFVRTAKVTVNA